MTHFSLFSGIGGIDLAAEWAGFETVGQCEFADYPYKVLRKHWPDVPKWRDVRDVTAESFRERTGHETLTLLSGGFPCQPHSLAGKRLASGDERDLWDEFVRCSRELKPRWVLGENVYGLLSSENGRFFGRVLRDLAQMGYTAGWCCYGAVDVGAPHKRDRVFFVANTGGRGFGEQSLCGQQPGRTEAIRAGKIAPNADGNNCNAWRPEPTGQQREAWPTNGGDNVADTTSGGLQEPEHKSGEHGEIKTIAAERTFIANACWWAIEPDVGRVAHGVPARVDRLKCLGNAVVPQQVFPILSAIAEIERSAQSE